MRMEKAKQIAVDTVDQFRRLWKTLLFIYLPMVLFFVMLNSFSRSFPDITLSYLTRDISAIGGLPFYAGLVSQLGGLLWSGTLAICMFTAVLLARVDQPARSSRRYLLHAALLTGVLMLDDFFLFHEDIGPDYLHISEKIIVLAYLLFTAVFLLFNSREILASEYLILGLSLALFGMSILLDAANLDNFEEYGWFFRPQFQIFLEDGFKFMGIATWLVYFARYAFHKLVSVAR
jgi:hypothetical protein